MIEHQCLKNQVGLCIQYSMCATNTNFINGGVIAGWEKQILCCNSKQLLRSPTRRPKLLKGAREWAIELPPYVNIVIKLNYCWITKLSIPLILSIPRMVDYVMNINVKIMKASCVWISICQLGSLGRTSDPFLRTAFNSCEKNSLGSGLEIFYC